MPVETKLEPICAFTIAFGKEAAQQANQLRETFNYFHPDIPFFTIDERYFGTFTGQAAPVRVCEIIGLRAVAGFFLSTLFDRVLYFDSDIVVFNRLDALVDTDTEVLLTNDRQAFEMGPAQAQKINSGVISAKKPEFWLEWTSILYSIAFPVINWLGDQFALRLLAQQNRIPCTLLDEITQRVSYNTVSYSYPGSYSVKDNAIWRGEFEIKAYHWAGQSDRSLAIFPAEVREYIDQHRDTSTSKAKTDEDVFQSICYHAQDHLFSTLSQLMPKLPVIPSSDPWLQQIYQASNGLMWTWAPIALDKQRGDNISGLERISQDDRFFYYIDPTRFQGSIESATQNLPTHNILLSLNTNPHN